MSVQNAPTLVSVIVPIYNMQRYLAETIEAILASDYPHFEVILMDDGSKDNSLAIAREYEQKDSRIRLFSQANAGVSAARNHAIRLAKGEYILPVDADNPIEPNYISEAAAWLDQHPETKVVSCKVDYYGDKSGPMHFERFSLPMLARKNMIDNCAMYRKKDWETCGGYAEHILGREDWVFWISMFKNGGGFHRLPILGFRYRVHENSKRRATQNRKHILIKDLNELHFDFFEETLGGPLHYRRSWSKFLNFCYRLWHPRKWKLHPDYQALKNFVKTLPLQFHYGKGEIIYQGRNELRRFEQNGQSLIVKSFARPHWINRIVYGIFRKSKAQRSYEYAQLLLSKGILTPQPIAYYQERCGLCFDKSYYVCAASEKTIHFKDMDKLCPAEQECFLKAVGELTAKLHEAGIYHKDYSGGNILVSFGEGSRPAAANRIHSASRTSDTRNCIHGEHSDNHTGVQAELELLDLNRMRFGKVSPEKGYANFDRFHVNDESLRIMAIAYANARNLDTQTCIERVLYYHHLNHSEK